MLNRIQDFLNIRKADLKDFSALKVDLHSHLIPGIDDGAPDLETSLELIRGLSNLGFKKIITTPHIMHGMYNNTNDTITNGLEDVRESVKKAGLDVDIEAGAEYYLDESFVQRVKEGAPLLTFGARYVLFETGFGFEPRNLREIIFMLNTEGYKPVFAHPERYHYLHARNIDKYLALKDMGLYFQLNISSLTGVYTKVVRDVARKLIDHDLIDFVGSDLHNKKHLEYLRNSLNEIYLEKLLNSGNLLNKTLL